MLLLEMLVLFAAGSHDICVIILYPVFVHILQLITVYFSSLFYELIEILLSLCCHKVSKHLRIFCTDFFSIFLLPIRCQIQKIMVIIFNYSIQILRILFLKSSLHHHIIFTNQIFFYLFLYNFFLFFNLYSRWLFLHINVFNL